MIHLYDLADAMKRFLDRLNRVAQKLPPVDFDFSIDYKHQDSLYGVDNTQQPRYADQFGFLEFDQPLTAPKVQLSFYGAKSFQHFAHI